MLTVAVKGFQNRLVIQMADRHFLRTRAYLGLAHSVAVDGLIWWGAPMLSDLLSLNCPVVALNARLDNAVHHFVLVDNRGGARLMVEHPVDLGHQRIAFIAGPDSFFDSQERPAGYQEAMDAFGLDPVIDRGDLFQPSGTRVEGRRPGALVPALSAGDQRPGLATTSSNRLSLFDGRMETPDS